MSSPGTSPTPPAHGFERLGAIGVDLPPGDLPIANGPVGCVVALDLLLAPLPAFEVVGEDKDPISAGDGLLDVYSPRPPISQDPTLLLTYTVFFRGLHNLRCVQRAGKALHRVDEFLEFI